MTLGRVVEMSEVEYVYNREGLRKLHIIIDVLKARNLCQHPGL